MSKTYCPMSSCFLVLMLIFICNDLVFTLENGFCQNIDGGVQCVGEKEMKLTQLKSDYVDEVKLVEDDDRQLEVKTINLKPQIFEVKDFLTGEECDHFISVAKEMGLESSKTERQVKDGKGMQLMDINSDRQLDFAEMKLTLENGYDVFLEDDDLLQMYQSLNLDTNNDMKISKQELERTTPADIYEFIKKYIKTHPEKHSRYSSQVWLYPDSSSDDTFRRVQERVSKVVRLPIELIKLSDFQVVHYGVNGHYNAHLDSSHIQPNMPCCNRGKVKNCRICRYMTVLFYLNDVEEGGETAFPFANTTTINHTEAHLERVHHLYRKCEDAPLRVSASRGKAVFWYNHHLDGDSGWMGNIDEFTLHGGCPVKQGEKWIANFWIKTTDNKQKDLKRMRQMYHDEL
ncbi:transmembrane prolyl 4-hydroxylase-like [Mya arenaria]|uniref:transmembrane prolyl 4-hydroxylase-like n=1 Tax=Mya arenaria TaxID=6604 RepID=UPI0022E38F21|nr:transmembrane prolyl 4-hydroxylase-like [Mya arenaria]